MPSVLPGIAGVVLITLVAGGIAYIGDRVGHQVGRKRLTMFGLRPKYTSTIVAVGTGMVIALSVTLIALIVSSAVRTAFFRIGELNSQINELQSQALAQRNELDTTRNGNIVLTAKAPIAPATLIDLSRPEGEQLRAFARFFDETVGYVNRTYANANYGLAPYRSKSSDPATRANLVRQLELARQHEAVLGLVGAPALFIPIASTNLFRGETITFEFPSWADERIARAGDEIAAISVEGGKPIAAADYVRLASASFRELAKRGFPYPFFGSPAAGFDPVRFNAASAELARVRGRFRLVARSETQLYPHTGGFALAVSVEPARG